ncbi:MAG: hypothetical protein AAFY60_13440, partial [Myxococcota bacterium]
WARSVSGVIVAEQGGTTVSGTLETNIPDATFVPQSWNNLFGSFTLSASGNYTFTSGSTVAEQGVDLRIATPTAGERRDCGLIAVRDYDAFSVLNGGDPSEDTSWAPPGLPNPGNALLRMGPPSTFTQSGSFISLDIESNVDVSFPIGTEFLSVNESVSSRSLYSGVLQMRDGTVAEGLLGRLECVGELEVKRLTRIQDFIGNNCSVTFDPGFIQLARAGLDNSTLTIGPNSTVAIATLANLDFTDTSMVLGRLELTGTPIILGAGAAAMGDPFKGGSVVLIASDLPQTLNSAVRFATLELFGVGELSVLSAFAVETLVLARDLDLSTGSISANSIEIRGDPAVSNANALSCTRESCIATPDMGQCDALCTP